MTKDEAIQTMLETLAGNSVDFSRESPRDAARMGMELGFDAGYEFANRWNVIERDGLPKYSDWYWVTTADEINYEDTSVESMFFHSCLDQWEINSNVRKVIAWRPLPEPYQGESEYGQRADD